MHDQRVSAIVTPVHGKTRAAFQPLLDWCGDYMLPVGGRPIGVLFLEWFAGHGVRRVRFVLPPGARRNVQTQRYFGNGERWGVELSYIAWEKLEKNPEPNDLPEDGEDVILASLFTPVRMNLRAFRFAARGSKAHVVLSSGRHRHWSDIPTPVILPGASRGWLLNCLLASTLYDGHDWMASHPANTRELFIDSIAGAHLRGIHDYLNWQLELLRDPGGFPVYDQEQSPGVYLNTRATIEAGASLNICRVGSTSRICGGALVRDSIVGDNCLIERNARVENSIILDDSWIGPGVWIDQMIVRGEELFSLKYETLVRPGKDWIANCPGGAS